MHDPEFVLENRMHKIHWNFEIQTDPQILTRKTDLISINKMKKKNCQQVDFAILANHRVKVKTWILSKR